MSNVNILHKRGEERNLPIGNASELLYTTDTERLFYGGIGKNIEVAKKVDLESISTVLINHLQRPDPHTKEQVGLGNVDNTSDIDKPLSAAQKAYIDNAIADLKREILEAIAGTE